MRPLLIIPAALLLAGGTASISPADENGAFGWREVGQGSAPQVPRYTLRAGPDANATLIGR